MLQSRGIKACWHSQIIMSSLRTCSTGASWLKPDGTYSDIFVYNPIYRRKVPLIIPNENYVTWYSCGPTVYDSTHIGHASCYMKLDIIQRILRNHYKYNVVTAMNITDIDDKIIHKSQVLNQNWLQLARSYEDQFWDDLKSLNIATPNLKLRVTDHIPQIVRFIESILSRQKAYVIEDGSVYFDTQHHESYGKFVRTNPDNFENTDNNAHKRSAMDFCLWKSRKHEHEPYWKSPWGLGRPGWHTECSTLASLVFGESLDFHTGGLDLKFPHHENEEAQCCVYHNTKQWVNYWMHTGPLIIKGQSQKMSKSLKNTITVSEFLSKYSADEFRMACMLSHYRNSMEYCDEYMETARNTLNKFHTFQVDCDAYLAGKKGTTTIDGPAMLQQLEHTKEQLEECLKDDFDTSHAITCLLDLVSSVRRGINSNSNNLTYGSCLDCVAAVNNFIHASLRLFGFRLVDTDTLMEPISSHRFDVSKLLENILRARGMIRERAIATKSQELLNICDEIRCNLKQNGIIVRDHSQGSSWTISSNKTIN